jgi:hypothetical protein
VVSLIAKDLLSRFQHSLSSGLTPRRAGS